MDPSLCPDTEQRWSRRVVRFDRNRKAIVDALQLLSIRRNLVAWQVVHAFVKTCVKCHFRMLGFCATPWDVFSSMRNASEEHAFASMIFEFGGTLSRGTNSDTTTKCSETGEIFGFASAKFHGGFSSRGDSG